MSIVIKNLTKSYGQQKAVNNISFEIKPGEIVGFIGPNGSGKSTTMKCICGIHTPDEGDVFINGKSILESDSSLKKQIGYLPESNPLYYDMYIEEYLIYVAKMYGLKNAKEAVKNVVKTTGLTPERTKKIGQLSKGYKQRVGIAQAILHEPEVLILDEPTTGLDPNQLIEIRELIKNLGKNKMVLLSTHILQEVEAICHRVVMINRGAIVTDNKTSEVKSENSDFQVVRVEFRNAVSAEELNEIPDVVKVVEESEKVFRITGSGKSDLREVIFEFAANTKNLILELSSVKQSLEDKFKDLAK